MHPVATWTLCVVGVFAVLCFLAAYAVEKLCDLCDPLEGE